MYEFLNSKNALEYEKFVSTHGSFTQSLEWANVKANWESEAVISRNECGEISGTCMALIKKAPFCSLMYAPRGPVCDYSDETAVRNIAEGLDALAKKYRAFACVCDPIVGEKELPALRKAGFTRCDIPEGRLIQCPFNYVLKLMGKTSEEVCAGFKSDYRNRIKKAQKRGVWCEVFHGKNALAALPEFYRLMVQTGKHDGFPIRGSEYFARFLTALHGSELFMCYAEIGGVKTALSGAVTVNYGGRFSYVYGASSDFWRNFYPSYLMQWTMIRSAIESGCEVYDFGGVPFYRDDSRPEYGMYRFKKGFGGEVAAYAGQFEKIYRPLVNRAAGIFSAALR